MEKLLLRALGPGSLISEAPPHPGSLQKERVEIRPCRSDGVMGSQVTGTEHGHVALGVTCCKQKCSPHYHVRLLTQSSCLKLNLRETGTRFFPCTFTS